MSSGTYVHLDFEKIIRETDSAFLIRFTEWEGEHWIPFSQIADVDDYIEGDEDRTISITEWIAQQKGLE